jgi:hypothetical protein
MLFDRDDGVMTVTALCDYLQFRELLQAHQHTLSGEWFIIDDDNF